MKKSNDQTPSVPSLKLYEGGEWDVVQLEGRPSIRGAHEALDVAAYAMAGAIESAAITSLPVDDQPKVVSLTDYRLRRNSRDVTDL